MDPAAEHPLTEEEWREAFRRACIITDWTNILSRPTGIGADGMDWCAEAPQFDVEANARAILSDEQIREVNSDGSAWLLQRLIQ